MYFFYGRRILHLFVLRLVLSDVSIYRSTTVRRYVGTLKCGARAELYLLPRSERLGGRNRIVRATEVDGVVYVPP